MKIQVLVTGGAGYLVFIRKLRFPNEAVSRQSSAISQENYFYSFFTESRKLIAERSIWKRLFPDGNYLGSILCEYLIDPDTAGTGFVTIMYEQNSLFHLCAHPHLEFISGDVHRKELMHRLIRKSGVLLPLAAVVEAPAGDRDPWQPRSFCKNI